jgi:heat-inducible transcriptional repressor
MKNLAERKPSKDERERGILLGLVELYIEQGKPIGSNTLRENGFEYLSSATIRNYFVSLEEGGYLKQPHSSGGRMPTVAAFQLYAQNCLESLVGLEEKDKKNLDQKLKKETRALAGYLQIAVEFISEMTKCAVFISAPKFDSDFVLDVKLVSIDHHRVLCVIITDYGLVNTEILYVDKKLSSFSIKRLENYFRFRLIGSIKPNFSAEEESFATKLYSEAMLRYLVGANKGSEDVIYKTGFSKLLSYFDFNDASALAEGLSIFENSETLRSFLREAMKNSQLHFVIGGAMGACSLISISYFINYTVAGSIIVLGPNRIDYRKIFAVLKAAAEAISNSLTKSMYKFKIGCSSPKPLSFKHLLLEKKNE